MNINDFVGIPYKKNGRDITGCDCYGLHRLLFFNLKNIVLPEYKNVAPDKAIHNLLILEEQKKWKEVHDPEFLDGVCFKIFGLVTHVGTMIGREQFIHAWKGSDACIESINAIHWRHRIDGFFRHKD